MGFSRREYTRCYISRVRGCLFKDQTFLWKMLGLNALLHQPFTETHTMNRLSLWIRSLYAISTFIIPVNVKCFCRTLLSSLQWPCLDPFIPHCGDSFPPPTHPECCWSSILPSLWSGYALDIQLICLYELDMPALQGEVTFHVASKWRQFSPIWRPSSTLARPVNSRFFRDKSRQMLSCLDKHKKFYF